MATDVFGDLGHTSQHDIFNEKVITSQAGSRHRSTSSEQQANSLPTLKNVSTERNFVTNYVSSSSVPTRKVSFAPTTTQSTLTSTTTVKPTTKKITANLPDEVPDDLRQQLLSSGILENADISVLDYDKVGGKLLFRFFMFLSLSLSFSHGPSHLFASSYFVFHF